MLYADRAAAKSVSDQIRWLKDKLSSSNCVPGDIRGVELIVIDVFVAKSANGQGEGKYSLTLGAAELGWVKSIGARFDLTVDFVND